MTTRITWGWHPSLHWLLLLTVLLAPLVSYADGGFLWKKDSDLREPAQNAIILYDQGVQEMLLQVRYEGPASQFGWIVPVPTEPSVEPATMKPFYELSRECQARQRAMDGARGPNTVNVLWTKTVGTCGVTLIKAGDAMVLEDWLNRNGFGWPAGKQEVLDHYIRQQWYFIAVRVNLQAAGPGVLLKGELPPLKISFATPECIFPLKISSINAGPAEVHLYLIGRQPLVNRSLDFFTLNEKRRPFTPERRSACVKELPRLLDDDWCLLEYREYFSPDAMEDLVFQPVEATQWPALEAEYARRYCKEGRVRRDLANLAALGSLPSGRTNAELTPIQREAAEREYTRVAARLHAVEALVPEEVTGLALDIATEGWPTFLLYSLHYELSPEPMNDLATVLVRRMLAEKDDRLRGHYRVALSKTSRKAGVVTESLLTALPTTNSAVRLDSLLALADTGDPRAFEPIAKVAQQDDPPISMLIALGKLNDPRGIAILHEALRVPRLHYQAAYALSLMRTPAVIDELIALLDDPQAGTAARALGEIGDQRAVTPLIEHFLTVDNAARRDVAVALGRLRAPKAIPLLIGLLGDPKLGDPDEECSKTLATFGAAAAEPLVAAIFRAGDNPVNYYINVLSRIGTPAQPAVLAAMQKTTDTKIRKSLFSALECTGDTDAAIPYLRRLLAANTDTGLCRDCMLTIFERTETLPEALREEDETVRCLAAAKLAPGQDVLAFTILIDTLQSDDLALKRNAVEALRFYHDERTVKALEPLLAEERLRQLVIETLGYCGAPAVPVLTLLLQHQNQEVCSAAIRALGACGAPAVPVLIPLLQHPDHMARVAAISALGQTGQPQAVDALALLLAAEDEETYRGVVFALANLEDERAVMPLVGYLRAGDSELQRSAIGDLGRLKDPRAVEPLITCLNNHNTSIVIDAIAALGQLDDLRAVESLIGKLGGSNNERNAALLSLNYLTGQLFPEQQQWREWWAANQP